MKGQACKLSRFTTFRQSSCFCDFAQSSCSFTPTLVARFLVVFVSASFFQNAALHSLFLKTAKSRFDPFASLNDDLCQCVTILSSVSLVRAKRRLLIESQIDNPLYRTFSMFAWF